MNWTIVRYSALVAWCVSAMGCTVCQQARRTLWQEPAAYSWKHDRHRSAEAYLQWANAELADEASRCPDLLGDPDYVMGFRDGFVDFVWAGGTGEPPPVPPRHFWNVMLRSPDGKARATRWFDGYRHGAAVARHGGYRDLGTVRSSLVGFANGREHLTFPSVIDGTPASDAPQPSHEGEILPEPPFAAPPLPPASRTEIAPAQESSGLRSPETAPESTPAAEQPPFQDDPQPPAETFDQPLSMVPATPQQRLESQPADAAENRTALHEADTGTFDVQPAILLKIDNDDPGQIKAAAKNRRPVSTMKFVAGPRDSGRNSARLHLGKTAGQLPHSATTAPRSIDRPVNFHGFRGWSRSAAPQSPLGPKTTPHDGQ